MLNSSLRTNLVQTLQSTLSQYSSLAEAFDHLEPLILGAFGAKRLSIFYRRSQHKDLVSRFKTGNETLEIKVPVNTQSIAGYVAMSQHAIMVNDPYNDEVLQQIHFRLRFDKKYDQISRFKTENVLCVPIKFSGVLLGVVEILNKESGDFEDQDIQLMSEVADLIGNAFKYELGGTARPFDYLAHKGYLDPKILTNLGSNKSIKYVAQLLNAEHQIPEDKLCEALSIYYQVPYISFQPADFKLSHTDSKLSLSYLKHNSVAIIKDNHQHTIILMFDPNNTALLMEIESALGTDNYQIAFSLPSQIMQYLGETSSPSSQSEFDNILGEIQISEVKKEVVDDFVGQDEPAIVRLVSNILQEAKRIEASDIHIDPERDAPTLVRMRVDGIVRDINQVPELNHSALISRIKIMSGLNISEKRLPQDGKLNFTVGGQNVEVRVATIPTVVGEGVVMRILASGSVLPMNKMNLSQRNLKMLESMLTMPHGIVLVVGPTGSGKTTTLHAILSYLNTPDKKIWTAEDPVEIKQARMQQVQVNPKIGYTFAKALRAFLRADPDIILIGEMRDKETASAGIEASLTGHMVLSTLHTNSAPETVTRLIDLGMDPVNFSDACIGILAQRLVRVLCKTCKEKYLASDTEMAFIKRQYGEEYIEELQLQGNPSLFKAKGCKVCDETGYKGRTGVHELLAMTPELRTLVYKGSSVHDIKTQSMKDGMRTLTQDVILKVLQGDTDLIQAQILSGGGMLSYE